MADRGRGPEWATACNDTCGCDVPCPGGSGYRCETMVEVTHALFTCGAVPADAAVGKEGCMCGPSCTCKVCRT